MRGPVTFALIVAALALLVGGCGGAAQHPTASATTSTTATATTQATAELEAAVSSALRANAKVSDYVLENNSIPRWASQSTGGPALAGMRSSAAQRKEGNVRVRVLSSSVQVHSVTLEPSYLSATAKVTERSRVIVYRKGRALGKSKTLVEPARIELHRNASKLTFVVWKIGAVR